MKAGLCFAPSFLLANEAVEKSYLAYYLQLTIYSGRKIC